MKRRELSDKEIRESRSAERLFSIPKKTYRSIALVMRALFNGKAEAMRSEPKGDQR